MPYLTEKEVITLLKRVAELEKQGSSLSEICRILKCAKKTIHKYKESSFIERKNTKCKEQVTEMLARGLKPVEIAKLLGCSRAAVYLIKKDIENS